MTLTPTDARPSRRSDRWRHVRGWAAVLFSLAIVAGLLFAAYLGANTALAGLTQRFDAAPDYTGSGTGRVTIVVEEGDTAADIATRLEEADVVASTTAFVETAAANPESTSIQPGTYRLQRQVSAAEALAVLLDPASRVVTRVTVPEGLRVSDVVSAVTAGTRISADSLEAALDRPDQLGLPSYARDRVEGFLFPATYELEPGTTARALLVTMVDRFEQAAREVNLVSGAAELGVSPYEAVTIASLVEGEAQRSEDYGKVARVIYNRLEDGVALQLDSTVNYATGKGAVRPTEQDRAVDSPYNTYLQPGLPPGPISSPGEAALRAAIDPTPGDWRYFVTVNLNTGETKFAVSYADHLANVEELNRWQLRNE